MDTDQYPSLPNLAKMHAQLAVNSRRVEAVVNKQMDEIERLFSATTAEDWEVVAKVTQYLASLDPAEIDNNIIRTAQQLLAEFERSQSKLKPPKHLASLLEACRVVRKRVRS